MPNEKPALDPGIRSRESSRVTVLHAIQSPRGRRGSAESNREQAQNFADSTESRLGPLKTLDRETNEVVYVSRAGRLAGSLTGRGKPSWQ